MAPYPAVTVMVCIGVELNTENGVGCGVELEFSPNRQRNPHNRLSHVMSHGVTLIVFGRCLNFVVSV